MFDCSALETGYSTRTLRGAIGVIGQVIFDRRVRIRLAQPTESACRLIQLLVCGLPVIFHFFHSSIDYTLQLLFSEDR
jgi:hypothetical protein